MRRYRVQEYSLEEAARLLRKSLEGPLGLAKQLAGSFDIVCREKDGSIAWEHHKPNIFTDHGRRSYLNTTTLTSLNIVTGPSIETPLVARYSLFDDGNASSSQTSSNVSPTTDVPTLTKTYSTTFAAPAQTRTIGMVGVADGSWSNHFGLYNLIAYTLLPTPKTQTSSQTLEIVYKLTLTPAI